MQKTLFLFQLTEDNEADEHDVYCELPDGGLDVPLPVQGTFVKVGIKISFLLEIIIGTSQQNIPCIWSTREM